MNSVQYSADCEVIFKKNVLGCAELQSKNDRGSA